MAPRKGELTEEERQLLTHISQGNIQETRRLLGSKDVRVNCLDEHGMTPLMHAAYKGKVDMCKLLLQHGADVNCNEHEHGYTALMFAGLSGNKEIAWLMLEAGADADVVNSVGRTAAQMAAFVGQHDCVTVINNFFPREKLDYYTKTQGLNKEPKLPSKLAGPLYKVITTTNLHPVKIVFLIKENPLLMEIDALKKCCTVLDLICEKCMKQKDMNEVLAVKMHYISCVMQKCSTFLQDQEDKLDNFIKNLLKGRDPDCFPVFQEKFIRECIRKFPYCEATLLQQLVRSIAPVEIGSDPTAFSILTQAITGQVGFIDADFCTTCGEKGATKRCSVCKLVIYCDQNCQKLHWFTHKKVCKMLKEKREKQEEEAAREKRRQEKLSKKVEEMKPVEQLAATEGASNSQTDASREAECPPAPSATEGSKESKEASLSSSEQTADASISQTANKSEE